MGTPASAAPDHADRDQAPSSDEAARARVLLEATNAFLVCDDVSEIGRAITAAMRELFAPDKAGVTLRTDDGALALVDCIGYDDAEQARIRAALTSRGSFVRQVLDGVDLWSDDPDREAFQARIREFGAASGFSLPISSPTEVVGTVSATWVAPRTFDPAIRGVARNLATQAGLAISLLASRQDAQHAAAETSRRHRTSTALLQVAGRLAGLADHATVPASIAEAVRDAAHAASASVARITADGGGFTLIANVGLTPEQAAFLDGRVLPAEPGTGAAETMAGRPTIQGPDSSTVLARLGIAVAVSAPIVIDGRIWGFVAVADPDERFSHDDLLELVTGFAAIAATAIARVEAVGELDRQHRRSDTLLELSSLLADLQERPAIEAAVSAMLHRASGAPFAMVGRRDRETDRFVVAATDGLDDDQVERIAAAMRTTDRPSLRGLVQGELISRTGEEAVGAGMGIGHAMGAPIVVAGRTEGFIAIGAPSSELIDPSEWQELLTALAAVTATALARADAVGALARQRDTLASEVAERTRSLQTALDELRLASDAKTDFLANVSHELRTPLTSILGFAEILASGDDGPLNPEQARDLETVRVSSRHLLELIDDLIDIASIESGRIQLQVLPLAAGDVVRDAAETIRPLAVAKGTTLEVAIDEAAPDGSPLLADADRGRLREIVLNLLSNAVKFTPDGGRVSVSMTLNGGSTRGRDPGRPGGGPSASPPGIPAGGSRPMVAIAVRDTGPGIAPEDQERIFEKFVRIAAAATPGTGLGLAISRELARLHGGDLSVESAPGQGSTFIVRIPAADGR